MFDYAILYLKKNKNGDLEHYKTYFTPIILFKNGKWFGYNYNDESNEGYVKQTRSSSIKIKKT